MANLKVVGSSSKGNSYIIETSNESLILELGCKWNEILESIEYNLKKVRAALVSHHHL